MPIDVSKYHYLNCVLIEAYKRGLFCKGVINGACDCNWIKEYELFYNKQPNSKPHVQRLLFNISGKKGKTAKAGFVNIRPVTDGSEVTETYLIPPKDLSPPRAYIKCLDTHDIYGEKIVCVPFVMPESIFGMCIHASIWICLKILESRGMIDEVPTIPEIQILATGRPYTDKQGLVFVQASRLLRMCRTNAFYINNREDVLNDNAMILQLYAYIESGLPVILGVDTADVKWWKTTKHTYHSIVAIGHTMKDNKVDGFIMHDESSLPYQVMTKRQLLSAWHKKNQKLPESFIRESLVAVPPEVSLPFHEAYHGFDKMLRTLRAMGVIDGDIDALQFRPMLKEPNILYFETRNTCLFRALREAGFPKYVWVMYFYNEGDDLNKAKGFFVRDATMQTEFIFAYVRSKGTAIYQLDSGKTYQRWDSRQNRKRIRKVAQS